MGHMDQQAGSVQPTKSRMASVDGVGLWRVVLQIDPWKRELTRIEKLEPVVEEIPRCLIHDQVEIEITNVLGRNLDHVVGEVEGRPAPPISFSRPGFVGTNQLWSTRARLLR